MPKHWLLKREPDDYSFEDLEREGRATWDGVKNNLALKYIRQVESGDEAFFYHTGKQRAVVGIARIETEAYPDANAKDGRLMVFDVRAGPRLAQPVTLESIKSSKKFGDWELVRMPRLSVMPVPKEIWSRIIAMSRG